MLERDEKEALRLKAEGNVFFGKKAYRSAIDCYDRAIVADFQCKEAWLNKALSHSALQETTKALHALTNAIQIDPGYTKAVYNKASFLMGLKSYALAIDTMNGYFANGGKDPLITSLFDQASEAHKKKTMLSPQRKVPPRGHQTQTQQKTKTASLSDQLIAAIRSGDRDRLISVLDAGADPNGLLVTGHFPQLITHANTEKFNPFSANAILSFMRAKPEFGESPLYLAARLGHLSVVDCLLTRGAEVNHANGCGLTALMVSITEEHTAVAMRLLEEQHIEIDHPVQDGSTALLFACEKGNVPIIKALIQKGASVNHADEDGETPLMSIFTHGHLESIMLLLNAGANPNQCKPNGVSPLFLASQDNQLPALKHLIRCGADFEIPRKTDKLFPLMIAAYEGHTTTVFYLLACGADPMKRCCDHRRADDYAKINHHSVLFKKLSAYYKNRAQCAAQFEKGVTLFKQGNVQKAIDIFQTLSTAYRILHGQQNSVDLATNFCELSACYMALGQPDVAEVFRKKADDILCIFFGETHMKIQVRCIAETSEQTAHYFPPVLSQSIGQNAVNSLASESGASAESTIEQKNNLS